MSPRFIRRNRVDERFAVAIASVGAVAATFAGARPTGSAPVDVLLVALASGAVVWASASAQWWSLAAVAGVSAVIAVEPLTAAVGGLAFLAALHVGTWRREQTLARALIGAVTVNLLIRSELEGFFGLSACIGIAAAASLFVLGLLRRPSRIRRIGWMTLAGIGGVAAIAMLGVLASVVSARPDVTSGATTARQAVRALNDGDYERSARLFADASVRFENADSRFGGVLAAPGRLMPVVAQNLKSGSDLSAVAATASAEAAAALREIDPAALRLRGGRIDLDAVADVGPPLQRVDAALAALRQVVDDVESPWLIGAVQDELERLNAEYRENAPRLRNAIEAVRLAPQILGADEPRRYLMLFTTPAEARGLGGFVGNFAVVDANDGRVTVDEFGRAQELSALTRGADCSECPAELLQRYGLHGFTTGPDGTVGSPLYANITMPAHFPYVAEAVDVLYPQATGQPIDGVMVVDPYVVQALMGYSGPAEIPELDIVVQPEQAAQFILSEQYLLAQTKNVRVEALDSLAVDVIGSLLRSDLPDPAVVARDLGPLIAERRLLMWTTDPQEQNLFERIGLLGAIPPLDPVDGGFSVSVSNASASKIDAFLERTVDVRIEPTDEGRELVAHVTFVNNAPASGLPDYVIGNSLGLPDGYSRLLVTFYGPSTLETVTLDGEEFPVGALPEAGWTAYSGFVDLAPGQQRTFRVVFSLPPVVGDPSHVADPTLWLQPLAERS